MTLRQQIPELTPGQWQLLERELLAASPERLTIEENWNVLRPEIVDQYEAYNSALNNATDSIRKALSE